MSWYRAREQNYKDDLAILGRSIQVPVLFIQAIYDVVLPLWMGENVGKLIPNLTRGEVRSAHWVLW